MFDRIKLALRIRRLKGQLEKAHKEGNLGNIGALALNALIASLPLVLDTLAQNFAGSDNAVLHTVALIIGGLAGILRKNKGVVALVQGR